MKIEIEISNPKQLELSDIPNVPHVYMSEVNSLKMTIDVRLNYSKNYLNIEYVLCKYECEYSLFSETDNKDHQIELISKGFTPVDGDLMQTFNKQFIGNGKFLIHHTLEGNDLYFNEYHYIINLADNAIKVDGL